MKTRKKREKRSKDRYFVFKGGKYVEISSNDPSFDLNTQMMESHNCYSYYLNKVSGEALHLCKFDLPKYNMCRRSQPGYASGYPQLQEKDYTCKEIMKRTIADNPEIRVIRGPEKGCKANEYMGAVVVAPKYDYHYYRYNDEGQWTHKPGYKPTTNLDANNNVITDPKTANRNYNKKLNYTQFCGYTCVPRNPSSKRMSHVPIKRRRKTQRKRENDST
jgi:hypothetical protein